MLMNYLWVAFIVLAVIAGGVTGSMQGVLDNLFEFADVAVQIALGLIGIMAFFCGLMKLMEKAGLCEKLGLAIRPITKFLFPEVPKDHPANAAMAVYFAASMLGLGNACTPLGIKSYQELQKLNKTKNIATDAEVMLLALDTTSITLIPVTCIGLRAAVQTSGAAEIIMPCILATTCSTVVGITATLLLGKLKKYKYDYCIEKHLAAGTLEINEDYEGDDPLILPEGYVCNAVDDSATVKW